MDEADKGRLMTTTKSRESHKMVVTGVILAHHWLLVKHLRKPDTVFPLYHTQHSISLNHSDENAVTDNHC